MLVCCNKDLGLFQIERKDILSQVGAEEASVLVEVPSLYCEIDIWPQCDPMSHDESLEGVGLLSLGDALLQLKRRIAA